MGRNIKEDRNHEMIRLRVENQLTYREIGNALHISKQRVEQVLKDYGFSGRIHKVKPKTIHQKSLLERIQERITITDSNCWVWNGTKTKNGYGIIVFHNEHFYPTIAIYEELVGDIPEGKQLRHFCNNKLCCNPDHLYFNSDPNLKFKQEKYLFN